MFKNAVIIMFLLMMNITFGQNSTNLYLPKVKSLSDIKKIEANLEFNSISKLKLFLPTIKSLKTLDYFYQYYETGIASWYGPGFHGRKTANGEKYNMYAMTAAHKTLPFGTMVKVTNISNGVSTIVRINDRGPFIKGRIIDLSKAAKDSIQMDGLAKVNLEIINE